MSLLVDAIFTYIAAHPGATSNEVGNVVGQSSAQYLSVLASQGKLRRERALVPDANGYRCWRYFLPTQRSDDAGPIWITDLELRRIAARSYDATPAQAGMLAEELLKLRALARFVVGKKPQTWPCHGCGRNEGDPLRIVGYAYHREGGRPTEVVSWTGCSVCNDLRPLVEFAEEAMGR